MRPSSLSNALVMPDPARRRSLVTPAKARIHCYLWPSWPDLSRGLQAMDFIRGHPTARPAAEKTWITGTSPVMTIKILLAIRSAKPDGLIAQTRHDGIEKWLRQSAGCCCYG
jgi:hypothetical protein